MVGCICGRGVFSLSKEHLFKALILLVITLIILQYIVNVQFYQKTGLTALLPHWYLTSELTNLSRKSYNKSEHFVASQKSSYQRKSGNFVLADKTEQDEISRRDDSTKSNERERGVHDSKYNIASRTRNMHIRNWVKNNEIYHHVTLARRPKESNRDRYQFVQNYDRKALDVIDDEVPSANIHASSVNKGSNTNVPLTRKVGDLKVRSFDHNPQESIQTIQHIQSPPSRSGQMHARKNNVMYRAKISGHFDTYVENQKIATGNNVHVYTTSQQPRNIGARAHNAEHQKRFTSTRSYSAAHRELVMRARKPFQGHHDIQAGSYRTSLQKSQSSSAARRESSIRKSNTEKQLDLQNRRSRDDSKFVTVQTITSHGLYQKEKEDYSMNTQKGHSSDEEDQTQDGGSETPSNSDLNRRIPPHMIKFMYPHHHDNRESGGQNRIHIDVRQMNRKQNTFKNPRDKETSTASEMRRETSPPTTRVHHHSSQNTCPFLPPYLVGPVTIDLYPSEEHLQSLQEGLAPGGFWHPDECTPRHKVAIIIPYRDRPQHLRILLAHLHPFLQKQQLHYGIFVIEEALPTRFNRAMLMNIGFVEAGKIDDYACYIFHDVDLLPEDDRNIYSCPLLPRHLSAAVDVMAYRLPYEGIFGGVSAMKTEHFKMINGFSNKFFGWGGEDDDMYNRIRHHNLNIIRYPMSIARYTMLRHVKDTANPDRFQYLYSGSERFETDGLNSLKYTVNKLEYRALYTWVYVSINEDEIMHT